MQVGGPSNVYPIQQTRKVYNIKQFLTKFGYNKNATLVIGAGICKHPKFGRNCEVYIIIIIIIIIIILLYYYIRTRKNTNHSLLLSLHYAHVTKCV